MPDPGPLGYVATLARWSGADARISGQGGPLPPAKARTADPTEHELYQGLADGWLHGTVGASLSSFFSEPRTRKELYVLFEKMDMTDIAGSFLDLISEDSTLPDVEKNLRVWTEGGSDAIQAANDALFKRLNFEDEITAIARDLAKFGDLFDRLVYRSGLNGGVRRMLPTPPLTLTRKEDKEGRLEGYLQTGKRFKGDNSDTSYPWDFVHFRIRGRDRRYPYGTSLLHNAIRPWKQFVILDDWAIGYQIAKHPDRNLILLDVGSASEAESADITRRFKQRLRKHILIDPAGNMGRPLGQRYDAMSPLEDMILPVRTGSATDVKKMAGSQNATDIVPLKLAIQRFFSAVRAPKEYFGFGDEGSISQQEMNPKATLTNQSVRYARTVKRLQQSLKAGCRYLGEFNLMLMMSPGGKENPELKPADMTELDFRKDGNDFTVHMGKITFLDELERLEVEQTRQQVALAMMELGLNNPAVDILAWTDYIMREIVKVPDDELDSIIRTDIEMAHIDNMQMGLMPNGEPVPEAPPQAPVGPNGQPTAPRGKVRENRVRKAMERRAEVMRRLIVRPSDRRATAQRDLTTSEKKLLSEAIQARPDLRRLIYLSKRLHEVEEHNIPYMGVLPDNELIKKGFLTDELTEEKVQEILDESVRDATGETAEMMRIELVQAEVGDVLSR